MLEKEFEEWCKANLQPNVHPIQKRDLRIAFYGGAGALWMNLIHPMIGRNVITVDLVELIGKLKGELNEFEAKKREGKV